MSRRSSPELPPFFPIGKLYDFLTFLLFSSYLLLLVMSVFSFLFSSYIFPFYYSNLSQNEVEVDILPLKKDACVCVFSYSHKAIP